MKCAASYLAGDRRIPCMRTAKWRVAGKPRCGTHARITNVDVRFYGRVPIEPAKERVRA